MTDSQSVAQKSPEGTRRAQSRARKRQLLSVARKLLVAQGFEKTSVSSIVRAAGVAQGTFYLYFKSKESLLPHLRLEVLADYLGAMRRGAELAGPADARLAAGIAEIYQAVRRNRPLERVFRRAQSGEETERIWLEGRETLAAPLAQILAAGAEEGVFRVDDARLAAHLVMALFDDLFYEALEYKKPAGGKRTLEHGSRFLLRALGVAEARIQELVPLARPGRTAGQRPEGAKKTAGRRR